MKEKILWKQALITARIKAEEATVETAFYNMNQSEIRTPLNSMSG